MVLRLVKEIDAQPLLIELEINEALTPQIYNHLLSKKTLLFSLLAISLHNKEQKNNVVPLSYISPTIRQIILNKRKTDLINKIQTEITNDAIKDNDFEIFK